MSAVTAGSAGLIFLRRGREELHSWERQTLERLRRRLALAGALDVLGAAALEAVDEQRPGELARRLFREPDRFRGRDADGALELLREEMRRDYAMGRTLFVGGWELAQTEARLFAVLHAMDQPSTGSRL
ncbi:MAG: hypothetical protein GEV06_12495 [Luteitalea sp.]|nr:hypothetical protein [Luteitalea sp.]